MHCTLDSLGINKSVLTEVAQGVSICKKAWTKSAKQILTDDAIEFIASLHRKFEANRHELLNERTKRQELFDSGSVPGYPSETEEVSDPNWKIADIPEDLLCRRVEITGPVNSAKMVINMLSRTADGARADCAMLDFEDSLKPSWENVLAGFHNVIGAAKGDLTHIEPAKNGKPEKRYELDPDDMAVVMVRCRGLHLYETNVIIDGKAVSAGLFDLALCAFHTAKIFIDKGKTPKYYVPKVEHFKEARWWNSLFSAIEDHLQLRRSTLRATFLIETLPAAFQMEEILFELREHAVGLNGGRWDKIFSDIKTLRYHSDRVMPDRSFIDMDKTWMKNYILKLIDVCHRRGAFAMGGMAAFTPGKDPELREQQVAKVKEDKSVEAKRGHDGCWVSHPFFIGVAMEEFTEKNQLSVMAELDSPQPDLLPQAIGPKTVAGLRKNIRVGIAYMHGWMHDIGCIAWDNLMEDLATLEISRAQVWQWLHHSIELDEGTAVTKEFVGTVFEEELERIVDELQVTGTELEAWQTANDRALELFTREEFPEFLTFCSEPML